MIQRIQSIYLLLVVVGVALMFIFPVVNYSFNTSEDIPAKAQLFLTKANVQLNDANTNETITMEKQFTDIKLYHLAAIAGFVGLMSLVTIFLYKKRILQIRLIAFIALANIGYIACVFFYSIDNFSKTLAENNISIISSYSVGTFIPIVTLVLLVLAQQAIKKDEKLVRSADRLRR